MVIETVNVREIFNSGDTKVLSPFTNLSLKKFQIGDVTVQ